MMIGRAVLVLAVVGAALTLAAGTALAAAIQCTGGGCEGTEHSDVINGSDTQDLINALAGDDTASGGGDGDTMIGGPGNDALSADAGNDQLDARDFEGTGVDHVSGGSEGEENILAADARVDYIDCGGGTNDFVIFDEGIDRVSPSCENRFPQ
jgi:Ca2+-binding RTX toxin-like protein